MALTFKWTLGSVSGGNFIPVTTGSYSLRVSPFSASTYAGTHVANGSWNFGTVADGTYQLWDESGTPAQVASFGEQFIMDNTPTLTSLTMAGNIAMGTYKLTGLGAGTTAGDSVRYDQAALLAGNNAFTGNNTFSGSSQFTTSGGNIPYVTAPATTGYPSFTGHLTSKLYVDTVFGSVVGTIQSNYMVRCIPDRSTEDRYSRPTLESCYSYLSGLSNLTSLRGVIVIEPTAAANCNITVDATATAWIGTGADIFSYNKVRITRGANNDSLTCTSRLTNVYLYDTTAAARTYNGFTFDNCDFFFDGSGNSISFTSCKFLGICRLYNTGDANLTNCTGTALWTNGTTTLSGSTPIDLRDGLNSTDLGF